MFQCFLTFQLEKNREKSRKIKPKSYFVVINLRNINSKKGSMKLTKEQQDYIEALHQKGAFLVPTKKNKSPLAAKGYNNVSNKPTLPNLMRNLKNRAEGVGLISGEWGLQTIDFDTYKVAGCQETLESFKDILMKSNPELWKKIYVERTQSGGHHVIFRAGKTEKTQVLAYKEDENGKFQGIIEYRGVSENGGGSYALIAPSEGYTQISELSIVELPLLKDKDAEDLLSCARYFNEKPAVVSSYKRKKENKRFSKNYGSGSTPWEEYDNATNCQTFISLVEKHGWKYFSTRKGGSELHFTRPGKERGTSAVLYTDKNLFHVYTSSASAFEQGKSYRLSIVYAILEYGGVSREELSKAAKSLFKEGYGHSATDTDEDLKRKEEALDDFFVNEEEDDDLLCEIQEKIKEASDTAALYAMQDSKMQPKTMLPQAPIKDVTYGDFPLIIQNLFSEMQEGHNRDFGLFAFSAMCTGVLSTFYNTVYGDEKPDVNILNFLGVGKSASGKGIAAKLLDLSFSKIFTEIRRREEEEKKECEEEMAKYKVALKNKSKTIPPRPAEYIPYAPLLSGEFTKAFLIENCRKCKPVLVFSSEADAVSGSDSSQFGGFSPVVRSLFQEGRVAKATVQHGAISARAQLSFVVTGTASQLPNFLGKNGIENGYFNRFMYCILPDKEFVFDTPIQGDGKTASNEIGEIVGNDLLELFLYCTDKEPLSFEYTDAQIQENNRFWRAEIDFLKRNYEINEDVIHSLSTRYSLMQARLCSLFEFLDNYNNPKYREKQRNNPLGKTYFEVSMPTFLASQIIMRKATRAAIEVAIWSLDETDNNTRFKTPKTNNRQTRTLLFAALPISEIGFTQDDVVEISEKEGFSYSAGTVKSFVKKWEKEGKIKLVGKQRGGKKLYKKL